MERKLCSSAPARQQGRALMFSTASGAAESINAGIYVVQLQPDQVSFFFENTRVLHVAEAHVPCSSGDFDCQYLMARSPHQFKSSQARQNLAV